MPLTRRRIRAFFRLVRGRALYLGLAAGTIGLGLASRPYAAGLPGWVGAYAGDALWALLVYWLAGAWQPRGAAGAGGWGLCPGHRA